MEFSFKVLVLLAFAVKLAFCGGIICRENAYKNDERLITSLSGWLYTLYTSEVFGNNEIFNCDVSFSTNYVYCETTNDNKCCRSFNISTTPVEATATTSGFYPYLIETALYCPQQLEENAHLKLLAGNTDSDGSYCFILWTCRPSREGVHAFCDRQNVSVTQRMWIVRKFRFYGQTAKRVEQKIDYRSGKCFPKSTGTGDDDFYQ